MHDYWRGLNKPHMESCSLFARFGTVRLYEDGLQKGNGKGNRHGT